MDALDPSNPLALKQIITGQEPDIATFRVPIQHNLLTSVGELFLNVDGVDATLQECDPATNGSGECVLVWNTTYETPGLHCLQPALSLGGAVPDAAETEGLGFAALFLSANVVQFDESYSQFDDGGAVLYASLAQADATYTIYLRDPSMSPSDPPIRTIANRSTSSGVIQESWNPADDGYSGSAVDAVFEVNLLDDPASGSNTQRLNKRSDGLIDGTFDVAYFSDQPEQAQEDGARWECYMGVVDTLMAPDFGYIYEYHSTFNDYTGDGNPSNPGFISDRARVTSELLPNLGDSQTRNFYCSGHGLPAMIFEGTLCSAYITRAEVAQTLGNSWRPDGIKMGHPYRFIFLDACNTAKRKGWQHTFGVCDHISQGGDQAFVGWEGAAAGPATDTECLEYADTLWVLFDNWMSQVPLKTCLDLASDRNTRPYGDSRTLTFPLPVPKNADIFVQNPRYYSKFTSNLRIAGNQWITRGTAP